MFNCSAALFSLSPASADGQKLASGGAEDCATEWHFKKKDGRALILNCKYRLNQIVDLKSELREIYFTIV